MPGAAAGCAQGWGIESEGTVTGRSIIAAINDDAVRTYNESGRVPKEAWITRNTFVILTDYIKSIMHVDIHEAAGDYDRPESPWYGSRPSEGGFQSLTIHVLTGPVNIMVLDDNESATR